MDRPSTAFSNMHKIKPLHFANIEERRKHDSERLKIERQGRRTRNFNLKRNITEEVMKENHYMPKPKIEDNMVDRKIALQRYIEKRDALKQVLKKKERPPFKVGIPHHGASPILKQSVSNFCQRITRSNKLSDEKSNGDLLKKGGGKSLKQEETNASKKATSSVQMFPFMEPKSVFHFQGNKLTSVKKLTSPHTPTVLKRSAKKNLSHSKNITNHKLPRNKSKLSTLSSDSVESLAVPLPQVELNDELKESSCVEKSSAQDELQNEPPTDESNDKRKSLIVQKPEPSNEYTFQRGRLDVETSRLLALTEEWETIALQQNVPADVIDEIDSVVGNTKLLTNDKFRQFGRLIEEYENHVEGPKITCEDLNGFWDMVYLQVEQLNKKFENLKILKNNNWEKLKPRERTTKRKRHPIQKSNLQTTSPSIDQVHIENTSIAVLGESVQDGNNSLMKTLMKSGRKQTRSYSPSPYISMRLSGAGRSMGRSSTTKESVDAMLTPTTASKMKITAEPQESAYKPDVLSDAPNVSETQEMKTLRRSLRLMAQPLTPVKMESCVLCNSNNEHKEASMKTPRKSLRLTGRSPTPLKTRECYACNSYNKFSCVKENSTKRSRRKQNPLPATPKEESCVNISGNQERACENITNSSRRSRKRILPMPSPQGEQHINHEENGITIENQEIVKPVTHGKKFTLKPSRLVVSDVTNYDTISMKTRSSRRIKMRETNETFSEEEDDSKKENSENIKHRRSTRKSSARKVTFDTSAKENTTLKLPVTPFRKSGGKKVAESPELSN